VFLLPLHLYLYPSACLTPLFERELHLFLPSLVCNLFILAQEPYLLYVLLFHIVSGVVVVVVGAPLEPILILKDHLLVVVREKAVKRKTIGRPFLFFKLRLSLGRHVGKCQRCSTAAWSFFSLLSCNLESIEEPSEAFSLIILYSILGRCDIAMHTPLTLVKSILLDFHVLLFIQ
jgi:hypothetical protein